MLDHEYFNNQTCEYFLNFQSLAFLPFFNTFQSAYILEFNLKKIYFSMAINAIPPLFFQAKSNEYCCYFKRETV